MSESIDDFCRDLLDEHREGARHDPESIAARFVDYFNVSPRPALEELKALLGRAGFGEVAAMTHDGAPRGLHLNRNQGETSIKRG